MHLEIIREPISYEQLQRAAADSYGDMVKAVVDIERKIFALGGELHADAEAILLQDGSVQENLWGINIYPTQSRESWIEFTSLINIHPRENNRSMEIQDPTMRANIASIINPLIQ